MTKKTKNYRLRILAVIIMIVALLSSILFMQKFLCISFSYDEMRIINFHKEPENSIDVLLIGSSATYSGFSSSYAYEKCGFTSYPYAIGGATCATWKPAIMDALHTQHPKLVVVDVFGGGYHKDVIDERTGQLSIIMSHTAFSKDKIETSEELCSLANNMKPFDYLFPFIKYHGNVPSNIPDLPDRLRIEYLPASPMKGLNTLTRARKLSKVDPESFTDETMPLDSVTEAIIQDFISYCKSKDIQLLFVKYPSVLDTDDSKDANVNLRANSVLKLAAANGCNVMNMQKMFYEIGLVENEDFYNRGHVNIRGAEKITDFLCNYLHDEMNIGPSTLSDADKEEWNACASYYHYYRSLAEELMRQERDLLLGDSPYLNENLMLIEKGEDVSSIAKNYHP